MDDFVIGNLRDSRNEWVARLVNVLTPSILEGMHSIMSEAWNLCVANDQTNKYLMTFQTLLARIPKWNSIIVEEERKRIVQKSGCTYLEELITCVHIIQLKVLTCIRVGNKQKKIDIDIPKLDHFLHKVYIQVARKIYANVYLFEKNISPLLVQRHQRECEYIVEEAIVQAVRESIPTEAIIRAYMEESVEQEEEVVIEPIDEPQTKDSFDSATSDSFGSATHDSFGSATHDSFDSATHDSFDSATKDSTEKDSFGSEAATKDSVLSDGLFQEIPAIDLEPLPPPPDVVPNVRNLSGEEGPTVMKLTFEDKDKVLYMDTNEEKEVNAPKTIERLERIATERAIERQEQERQEEEDGDKIEILPVLSNEVEPFHFDFETILLAFVSLFVCFFVCCLFVVCLFVVCLIIAF
jgi:hypothetical protein